MSVDDNAGSLTVDNAGTFAVQVDGAALTALQKIDDPVLVDDAAFTPGGSSVMMAGAEFDDVTPDSVDEGDAGALRMSARRELYVQVRDAAGNERGLNVDASGQLAVTVASFPDNEPFNVAQWAGAAATAGAGAVAAGTPRVTLASDDPAVASLSVMDDWDETNRAAVNTIAGQVGVQGASGVVTALTQRVVLATDVALPAGTAAIGKLAANTGVDIGDVDVLSIAAGTNLIGDVGLRPRTTGGLSFFKTIDLDETEEAVKATAGQLYGILAFNQTAAPLYLKLYNATVATVAVGTTVPDITLVIPGNADSDGAGFVLSIPQGIAFGTAITVACTTGVADADVGAPAANACVACFLYE